MARERWPLLFVQQRWGNMGARDRAKEKLNGSSKGKG